MPDINPPAAVVVPVIFSRRDVQQFSPADSPRIYTLAPLTFRERQAMRAEAARAGLQYPSQPQVLAGLRAAVREVDPDNAAELLALIDAHEATPDDADVNARLLALEMAMAAVPVYAQLAAKRAEYLNMQPWYFARYALRGWQGPDLPEFQRVRGAVPEALLDELPPEELEAVGWRASALAELTASARGNSGAPSPSPASLAPLTEG